MALFSSKFLNKYAGREPSPSFARVVAVATAVALTVFLIRRLFRRVSMPKGSKPLPGPKGLPIAGNAFDIPTSHSWLKFRDWANEFGPIYQLNAFGTTLVVVSNESIANDLFALKGVTYSDRPPFVMLSSITDDKFIGNSGWNEYWRRARRFAQSMLSTSIINQSAQQATVEARQMVLDLCQEPSRYEYWLERAGAMFSLRMIYGATEKRGHREEYHVKEITFLMDQITRLSVPGLYIVEFIPWLAHLPAFLAPFKREAKALRDRHFKYLSHLFEQEESKYQDETTEQPESFARRYLRTKDEWKLSRHEIIWTLSSIYGGASGTTSAAMQSIILNMCLYPEWQQKIQKELDDVVGDHCPTLDDAKDLPTVRAVIKESMRWRPVLPGGLPHAAATDDVYDGYHIPKGAVIFPNQWAIFRDEEFYPDPENFRPERWLQPSFPTYREPLTVYPNLKRFAGFGHGRRICPGIEVAENSLILQVSNLLWACTVRSKQLSNGEYAEIPYYDYTGIAISTPKHFQFSVQERKENRLDVLAAAVGRGDTS